MSKETQGQRARRRTRQVFTNLGIGPTRTEVNTRNRREAQVKKSATQGPKPQVKKTTTKKPQQGPKQRGRPPAYMMRARTPSQAPATPVQAAAAPKITAKERWRAMGAQSKAARAKTNAAPQQLANNTYTQTDDYSRRRVNETRNQSSGIGTGSGSARGGGFRPRDTALGRRMLGLPSRAEQHAQRVQTGGQRQNVLRQGQTRLNLPAANAERMAAADLRRSYSNARRRNASENSAVRLVANSNLMENQVDNMTSRRGQDMTAQTAYRGQDVTARGQDINANVQYRGQDVTARGQDLNYDSSLRGHDVTRRGQDIGADTAYRGQDVTMRGQDSLSETSRANTAMREGGANLRNRRTNDVYRDRNEADAEYRQGTLRAGESEALRETLNQNLEDLHTSISEDDDGRRTNITDRNSLGQSRALIGDPSNYKPEELSNLTRNIPQMVEVGNRINQYLSKEGYAGGFSIPQLKNAKFSDGKMGVFESFMNGHWPRFEYIELPGGQRIPADFFEGMALSPANIEGTGIDPGNEY
jgi:hypothetical protein